MPAPKRKSGHMVDVPITLTVALRGTRTPEQAKRLALEFFNQHLCRMAADGPEVAPGVTVSEYTLEPHLQNKPTVIERLPAKGFAGNNS